MNQCCQPFCDRSVARRAQLKLFALVLVGVFIFQVYVTWSFMLVPPVVLGASMILGSVLGGVIVAYNTFSLWLFWSLRRGKEIFLYVLDDLLYVTLTTISIAGFFVEELKLASLLANEFIVLRVLVGIVMAYLDELKEASQGTCDDDRGRG